MFRVIAFSGCTKGNLGVIPFEKVIDKLKFSNLISKTRG